MMNPDADQRPGRLLQQAAIYNNVELMESLLEGPELEFINASDCFGRTALYTSVTNNSYECCQLLLLAGGTQFIIASLVMIMTVKPSGICICVFFLRPVLLLCYDSLSQCLLLIQVLTMQLVAVITRPAVKYAITLTAVVVHCSTCQLAPEWQSCWLRWVVVSSDQVIKWIQLLLKMK